ncbi:putative lipid-binding protein AIR1B [Coffea eugenioides]|uniref:putative lipid-binding protein AIR1B n=1 Tax=Coffea eugenioides TaxID=49369 RepID=UPI000F60CD40|nr:putative lipid-binding protein AIR1B [Coffea eugenioides]
MVSKATTTSALFLAFNLTFFILVSACVHCAPPPPIAPPPEATCPTDVLELRTCANLLNLTGIVTGPRPKRPCCSLIAGLADLEAALCLCTAIKANILGIILNVDLALEILLNDCGKSRPSGYTCA